MKKLFLLSMLLICFCWTHAQSNRISQYLDDNGRTEVSNIIKTDVTEILEGNIPIILDHKFNNFLALQGGVGLLTHSFFKPVIPPILADSKLYPDIKGGYSLYLQPVLYLGSFESLHMGIPLKYRRHGNQASSFEWNVIFGYQWFRTRHLSFDLSVGVGVNYEHTLDNKSYIYSSSLVDKYTLGSSSRIKFPVSFTVGYVL